MSFVNVLKLAVLFICFYVGLTRSTLNEQVPVPEPSGDPLIGQDVTFIGGQGGQQSSLEGWHDGKVIEKLTVWCAESTVKAVKIWLSGENDDQAHLFGVPDNNPSYDYNFNHADGLELIKSMSLWGNGAGTRFGALKFETNKGGSFDHGMTGWGRKTEYRVSTYSGMLVGAIVNSGADIDALGFYFILPVKKCVMRDLVYNNGDLSTLGGIKTEELDEYSSNTPGDYKFSGEHDYTTSSQWSYTAGVTATVSVTVEAGIPEVAKVTGNFQWQVTESATYQTSIQTVQKLSWEQSGTLSPGQSVHLRAVTHSGKVNVPYAANMYVEVNTGSSFTYQMHGTYDGVDVDVVEVINMKDE